LLAGAIYGAVGTQEPRRIFQPVTAATQHCGTNPRCAYPTVMVSGNCAKRRESRQFSDQGLKRLHAARPVHQISAKQHNVWTLARRDVDQSVNNVSRSMLPQMKIARKQHLFPGACTVLSRRTSSGLRTPTSRCRSNPRKSFIEETSS
jgi:hypothetical protein